MNAPRDQIRRNESGREYSFVDGNTQSPGDRDTETRPGTKNKIDKTCPGTARPTLRSHRYVFIYFFYKADRRYIVTIMQHVSKM